MTKPPFPPVHPTTSTPRPYQGRVNLGLWLSLLCLALSVLMIVGVIMGLSAAYTERHTPRLAEEPEEEPIDFSQPAWAVTVPHWRRVRSLPSVEPKRHHLAPNFYDQYMNVGYAAYRKKDYNTALINFRRALDEQAGDDKATEAIANTEAILQKLRDSQQEPQED